MPSVSLTQYTITVAKQTHGVVFRKMKLLKSQAEGKKRMKMIGNIEIAKETFIKILTKQ